MYHIGHIVFKGTLHKHKADPVFAHSFSDNETHTKATMPAWAAKRDSTTTTDMDS